MNHPDLSKYDASGRPPLLDEGEYTIMLQSVKDTDKKGLKLQFKDGTDCCLLEFAVHNQENKLQERIVLDEDYKHAAMQLGKLKAMLIAMGVDPDKAGNLKDYIGKMCKAVVVQNGSGGKLYNNIDEYKPLDEAVDFGELQAKEDDDLPF